MKTHFSGLKKISYGFIVIISIGLFMLNSCIKVPVEDDPNNGGSGGSGSGSGGGSGGGSGSGCSTTGNPKTGSFGVKIYNPTGACSNTVSGYTGWLKGYYYCPTYYPATCGYMESAIGKPSGLGQTDGGGLYWYASYGDNPSDLCKGTLYRLEWELRPNKLSYPNSCIISGSSNIDFQGQVKQVVIRWP